MFDHESRVERLLARHRDAVAVEAGPGRHTVIRRDQILVAGPDAHAVHDRLRRWCDSRHDEPGATRLRLRPQARVDVCEVAAELSGEGRHRDLAVAPNHLVHGQPLWMSVLADRPRPVTAIAPPPQTRPKRPVTVAVLDTGLSPHPWYDSADWYAEQRQEVAEELDADLDYELDAQAGHGTFIAGVLLRTAPGVRIRAKRVIGGDGVGDELGVVRALDWLARWGRAEVVNVSSGCYTYDDRPSPVVARAVAALGRRTAVVAAAGNAAADRPFWPAALKSVIAVAALDGAERAWFSNYGWWVDACAPGTGITSCFVTFGGPRRRVPGVNATDSPGAEEFRGYARWSGTSFAAPAVAGAIAGLAATEDVPAAVAADRVLDPAKARTFPDLGVVLA